MANGAIRYGRCHFEEWSALCAADSGRIRIEETISYSVILIMTLFCTRFDTVTTQDIAGLTRMTRFICA